MIAPGAELLYGNAAERMLKVTTSGFVVGPSVVGGIKSTHLAFRGEEVDWQIWIEDGDKPLARKFVLTSKKVTGEPQFTVLIRSWDLTPKLTDQMFTFVPPKGAKKIEFLQLTAEAGGSRNQSKNFGHESQWIIHGGRHHFLRRVLYFSVSPLRVLRALRGEKVYFDPIKLRKGANQ